MKWPGWAELPEGMTWRHVYGLSVAGIGFTMALFISGFLSLKSGSPRAHAKNYLAENKIGGVIASFTAGIVGFGPSCDLPPPPRGRRLALFSYRSRERKPWA